MNETSSHSPIPTSAGVSQTLGEEAFLESLNLATPRTTDAEVRLDSGRTSPFLLNLAGSLERFLDVLGEVFELSPTTENGVIQKRPRTFEGGGFAISFPFKGGLGVFLVADRDGILAPWLANPGIAGKSRLLLLAGELERLFSHDWNEMVSPETGPETDAELKPFYTGPNFFHGRIDGLETLFNALPMETLTVFRSFTIRKFDGREGGAWMLGPLSSVEILVTHEAQTDKNARCTGNLRPVRSLECVTVGLTLPASFIDSETEPDLNDPENVCTEISTLPEIVYRFHFRTPLYSPQMRARREELILSQIHYEHPMNTQRWHGRAKKMAERFQVELQSKLLAAAYSHPIPVPVPAQIPIQPVSEIQLPPMASLVETKISCEGIEPVQVVDFPAVTDAPFEPVSVEWTGCGNDWSESSFVVAKSFEPPKSDVIQPEMLVEQDAEPEPVKIPRVVIPFMEDFSEEPETEAFPALTAPVDSRKVMEIPVPVSILLGRGKLPVSELLDWKVGTILNLGQKIDETCDLSINGNCVGRGFPIECENLVGTQIEKIMNYEL